MIHLRPIAYEMGAEAFRKGASLYIGAHIFGAHDIIGLYSWRAGWLDAQRFTQI